MNTAMLKHVIYLHNTYPVLQGVHVNSTWSVFTHHTVSVSQIYFFFFTLDLAELINHIKIHVYKHRNDLSHAKKKQSQKTPQFLQFQSLNISFKKSKVKLSVYRSSVK